MKMTIVVYVKSAEPGGYTVWFYDEWLYYITGSDEWLMLKFPKNGRAYDRLEEYAYNYTQK